MKSNEAEKQGSNNKKKWKLLLAVTAAVIAIITALYGYFVYAPAPGVPVLSSVINNETVRIGNLDRSYLLYIPRNVSSKPALVFVLHGSTDTAVIMREKRTAYGFDRLADQYGFIVVYPQGFENHWNDNRRHASYSAKILNIDDMGFITELIDIIHNKSGADLNRVYAAGYSNGGHMCFRLGMEMTGRISAIAVVAANLPVDDDSDCRPTGKPLPVMIIQGTADPLNSFNGGKMWHRGRMRSTVETAYYFVRLNGQSGEGSKKTLKHKYPSDETSVENILWHTPGKADVELYIIKNGGHVIPQPVYRYSRLLGLTSADIDAPVEIWRFFSSVK